MKINRRARLAGAIIMCGTGLLGGCSLDNISSSFSPDYSNASLVGLTITPGTLEPVFSSGHHNYDVAVDNVVTGISVTPRPSVSDATMSVNGNFLAPGTSASVQLAVGINTISILVVAEDEQTTGTYTLTVERASKP